MASSGPFGMDEDTARTLNDGRAAFGALLRTAQKRLQRVAVVFTVGMFAGILAMRWYVWPQLKADLLARGATVIAQTPFDVILLQVKIGLITGALLGIPVLLVYAREPLQERGLLRDVPISRWKAAVVAALAAVLFTGGMLYAYYLFFPIMFGFLANNAQQAGFAPMYSIVAWTQFILVLGLSFGLAAQLPLVMTALSYSGLVPYETFRDNWKYAIVAMFGFGALFSPPDPFTQIMWAAPLVALYAFSLYLSKILVTAKRGSEDIYVRRTLRARWNRILGGAVLVGVVAYYAIRAGAGVYVNQRLIPMLPAGYRPQLLPTVQSVFGVPRPVALAAAAALSGFVAVLVLLAYYVYRSIEDAAASQAAAEAARYGSPEDIPIGDLDAEGVRAAPPEAFAALSEEEALGHARAAMDDDDPEKAQAILDRFDEAEATREADGEAGAGDAGAAAAEEESGNAVMETTAGMVDAFTEDETTEDDIGGYYYDIQFILGSLRSRLFRIAGVFMLVLAGTFYWLYSGGIGRVRCDFLSRLPAEVTAANCNPAVAGGNTTTNVTAGGQTVSMNIVTLHPVEALVFEVKISTVFAAIVTLPLVAYYVWPALRERGLVGGSQRAILAWGGTLLVGVAGGIALGYTYVAPSVISWLVFDAVREGMVISYRVNNFFWLMFITTAGIGLLADVPISMLLFHAGGIVPYRTMRERWRIVAVGAFVFAALVTPDSLYTQLLVALPIVLAYLLGLGLLWIGTLGGRRGGGSPDAEATETASD